jgi:protein ImuB
LEDCHLPEQAERFVPIGTLVKNPATSLSAIGETSSLFVSHAPVIRPLRLFAMPERIEAIAEVPEGPPIRFRWRSVLHRVTKVEGPERIADHWWAKQTVRNTRDYFRIEDSDGHRYWLFREGLYGSETNAPKWFLHGLFA